MRARALRAAGVETVGGLLSLLPRDYQDRRTVDSVATVLAQHLEQATLIARIGSVRRRRLRRRGSSLVEGRVTDDTGALRAVWFNRPFLRDQIEPEREYLLHGRVRRTGRGVELLNASVASPDQAEEAAIVPVYGKLGDLAPSVVARLIGGVVGDVRALNVRDPIPDAVRARRGLPALQESLLAVHRPPPDADLDAYRERTSPHHRRLAYGELLLQQLRLARARREHRSRKKPHRYVIDDALRQVVREILPFRLTSAQRRVLGELVADLGRPEPMLRLLQGDVGCGKTVVAGLLISVALENALQAAFMAPTELLAEQHHRTLERLYGGRYRVDLLTGSTGDSEIRRRLSQGDTELVVGTHALITEGLDFERLGLAVIDEQHRFGVAQRRRLEAKGNRPDVLVMTATPIPRSLAMTAFGDLDLSVIDELPPGRRAPTTHVIEAAARGRVFDAVAAELAAGGQAFVVFPMIEESTEVAAHAVEGLGREYLQRFASAGAEVATGRMTAEQRQTVMESFASGRCRVLIATTVVEVGVDVQSAACMVIESAERFGLAQLHQLRGRVGRGTRPSTCWAVHGPLSDAARERLSVFGATDDGFRLAEADLAQRGPGELLGTRQAGWNELRLADPVRDRVLLAAARDDARELIDELPAGPFGTPAGGGR